MSTDTPTALAAERARAVKILRKGGLSAKGIQRVLGGARVASDNPTARPIDGVAKKIDLIAADFLAALKREGWLATIGDLKGPRTLRAYAGPRAAAMFLARYIIGPGASFPAIGAAFNRDHSTVMHAYRKIVHTIADNTLDPRLARAIAAVIKLHKRRQP